MTHHGREGAGEAMVDADLTAARMRGSVRRLATIDSFSLALGGFVSNGGTHLVLSELYGLRTDLLRGVAMNPGVGLGGRVLELRRPVAVDDYVSSASITHQLDRAVIADNIKSALALPVLVNGTVRAVVYGASRTEGTVSERSVNAAANVVAQLAHDVAVEDEVRGRVERIRQEYEHHRQSAAGRLGARELTDFHAELVAIAAAVSDEDVRSRLLALSQRLMADRAPRNARLDVHLSRRELDVLIQLAAGYTNAEIAERLSILLTTVKTHAASVRRKLGTRNRVETVAAARSAGLLP